MGIPDGPVPREIPAETMDAVQEIAEALELGLNHEALEILTRLCDYGVNPAALAAVVTELQKEKAALEAARRSGDEPKPGPFASGPSE